MGGRFFFHFTKLNALMCEYLVKHIINISEKNLVVIVAILICDRYNNMKEQTRYRQLCNGFIYNCKQFYQ